MNLIQDEAVIGEPCPPGTVTSGHPAQQPPITASMDAQGNVRMELQMTPDDRRMASQIAQQEAARHADSLASPVGLRGLFPSNRVRFTVKKRT